MKYALIGCGRISPNHIEAAKNNKLDICAICDINPGRMEDKAKLCGLSDIVRRYTDYKQLLEAEKPELVAIATESGKHAAIALDCINAGCHVIIEKPIALSIRDADALIQAAQRMQVKVCACHQNRFNKPIQKIRQALEAGRFGKLLHAAANIRWNRNKNYYEQAPWRGTWEQDGGALMNQCIHDIDLLRWMLGNDVDEVFAYTDRQLHDYIQAEDLGIALIKFKNGAYGVLEGTTNVYPNNLEETLCLFGERGVAKVGGHSVNIMEVWRFGDGLDDAEAVLREFHEKPPNVYGFGHTPLYTDVVDAIRTDREPYVTLADGKRVMELILAIYKSAAEGKPVKLPLAEGSTLDFAGRFEK